MKAIPTTVDGINFRSKLEAHWYVFLRLLECNPIYEPDPFLIEFMNGQPGRYLPDFFVPELNCYLEVKPLIDRYDERDQRSMMMAAILGYECPSCIILGSPFRYYAVLVEERHKGNPRGSVVEFMNSSVPSFYRIEQWTLSGWYPDENHDWEDPRGNDFYLSRNVQYMDGGEMARRSWNMIQWKAHRVN